MSQPTNYTGRYQLQRQLPILRKVEPKLREVLQYMWEEVVKAINTNGQDASTIDTGVVTDQAQTFGGAKTFVENLTVTKNQNARTIVQVNNSDATNANSQAKFIAASGTVSGSLASISYAGAIGIYIGSESNHSLFFMANGAVKLTLNTSSTLLFAEAVNIQTGDVTGTKIGTGTTQKVGFHNAAPSAQRAGAAQAAVDTTGATNVIPYGYTEAQANAIITLLNEIRAALVEKGLIKGAA